MREGRGRGIGRGEKEEEERGEEEGERDWGRGEGGVGGGGRRDGLWEGVVRERGWGNSMKGIRRGRGGGVREYGDIEYREGGRVGR